MRALLGLSLCVALVGCHGDGNHPSDLAMPDLLVPTHITIPGSTGTLSLPFSITVNGQGSATLGAIALQNGAGTVEVNGKTLHAVVHERQPWPGFDYTLYQTIAVGDSAWYVMWMYCTSKNQLAFVYFEGTDGTPMQSEDTSGTCTPVDDTPSVVTPALPPTMMDVAPLLAGVTVTTKELTLASAAPGSFTVGGNQLSVLPFNLVDCTKDCGTPGWYEVHSILSNPSAGQASFTIFYLHPDAPTKIDVQYSLTLPVLKDLIGDQLLTGSWTVDPASLRIRGTPQRPAPRVPWLWRPHNR